MDVDEAELLVKKHVADLISARLTAQTATKRATALEKVVAGYVELFPELKPLATEAQVELFLRLDQDDDHTPKGAEAVRRLMQERPNFWWYISELVTALRERDWLPESDNPANAVRTACERLLNSDDSDLHKGRSYAGKVAYSYRPDDEPWDGTLTSFRDSPESPYGEDEEPF
ncbi:MAG: hypothetical protein QOJ67_800 [Acidimicrobiaceae bacterium]|jgi:hypothetical protein